MKKVLLVVTSLLAFLSVTQGASAQSEIRRFEIGGQFSRINFDSAPISLSLQERTEPGFGGRFTYNINRSLALEAELNFLPRRENLSDLNNFGLRPGGRVLQGLFGVKAGSGSPSSASSQRRDRDL